MPTADELNNWFTYHPPKSDQIERYAAIRDAGLEFAGIIRLNTLPSPEQDQAIMLIRQAVMIANAAIACNE